MEWVRGTRSRCDEASKGNPGGHVLRGNALGLPRSSGEVDPSAGVRSPIPAARRQRPASQGAVFQRSEATVMRRCARVVQGNGHQAVPFLACSVVRRRPVGPRPGLEHVGDERETLAQCPIGVGASFRDDNSPESALEITQELMGGADRGLCGSQRSGSRSATQVTGLIPQVPQVGSMGSGRWDSGARRQWGGRRSASTVTQGRGANGPGA